MVSQIRNSFFTFSAFLCRHVHVSPVNCKTVPTNLKGKSKASQEWLIRQLKDPYVKKARELNYRARSAFKLIEIDDRFKLLRKGMVVVECGAAPGAWSQVVVDRVNSDGRHGGSPKGKIIGVDLLPIEPLPGAIFLPNSDFTSPEVQDQIQLLVLNEEDTTVWNLQPNKTMIDLILSDMAPNASGILDLDQAKLSTLVNTCLQFACQHGRPTSNFVAKVWEGTELKGLEGRVKEHYKSLTRVKPKSSRENSAELYLVAQGKLN